MFIKELGSPQRVTSIPRASPLYLLKKLQASEKRPVSLERSPSWRPMWLWWRHEPWPGEGRRNRIRNRWEEMVSHTGRETPRTVGPRAESSCSERHPPGELCPQILLGHVTEHIASHGNRVVSRKFSKLVNRPLHFNSYGSVNGSYSPKFIILISEAVL